MTHWHCVGLNQVAFCPQRQTLNIQHFGLVRSANFAKRTAPDSADDKMAVASIGSAAILGVFMPSLLVLMIARL